MASVCAAAAAAAALSLLHQHGQRLCFDPCHSQLSVHAQVSPVSLLWPAVVHILAECRGTLVLEEAVALGFVHHPTHHTHAPVIEQSRGSGLTEKHSSSFVTAVVCHRAKKIQKQNFLEQFEFQIDKLVRLISAACDLKKEQPEAQNPTSVL